jgi:hypothetical protein
MALALIPILLSGCTLAGAGTLRIGMTNSNFLEVGTNVDGDKEGKTASIKIDQTIMDALLPSGPSPDPEPDTE